MVRFVNKDLKAHTYAKKETISEVIDKKSFNGLTTLLTLHINNFGNHFVSKKNHLFNKLSINLQITKSNDFNFILSTYRINIKDLFLTLEIILESFHEFINIKPEYFNDFIEDINNFFLIHKIPIQIRYLPQKDEFYIEKIINPDISQKIKETLELLSENEKVFEDFKKSIKEFSSGNYPESIKLCCKSIEDYLCIILKKESCSSITSFYKQTSKKLKIPDDLSEKFNQLINYIHNYRSIDSHGRLKNVAVEDINLINEVIIQFTMSLLNYLKKKNEMN